MNIGDTLRFFRSKLNYTQKEMLSNHSDPSSYSRIENGKQAIRINELEQILDRLSVTTEEFLSFSSQDDEQQIFRELFYYCALHLENKVKKKKLLDYYELLKRNNTRSLRELSNYMGIKNYFHQRWEEVDPISDQEITLVFNYLIAKSYYIQYDFVLMSNTMHLFNSKQVDLLFNRVYPIKDEEKRDTTTKKFAYNVILNVISMKLYERDYNAAEKFILLAKKLDRSSKNYSYRMNLQYLNNLLNYLKTGDLAYINKVYQFINLLEDIGDNFHASQINAEVKVLIYDINDIKSSDYKVGLIKDN
ncbi:helix-turn-helix domain-containing protein [Enterococcus sp. LJL51]|uniref:helix-turn-helix domain-containing protein n=1 Tax=Enterococcus sp. LJL51 TaxID=3416656 RepID=UPI003CF9EDBD